jgi:integrase/recombinase XerD
VEEEMSIATEAKGLPRAGGRDLIQGFISDCRLRGMSEESIRGYRSNLLIFSRFLERHGISLLDVDREALRSFLAYLREERKVSHKRVENYFSALSSLYEYLAYEGYVASNPVLPVRRRYLRGYKKEDQRGERKLLSVEEMSMLVNSVLSTRDRAIITLLAKTGIRRGELIGIDVDDIDWREQSITLKPRAKRTNRVVFFDDETAKVLREWLRIRNTYEPWD